MSEYTPTTEEVRNDWASGIDPAGRRAEFDRWLAEVKAQAWEEGQDAELERLAEEPPRPNPYRQGEM